MISTEQARQYADRTKQILVESGRSTTLASMAAAGSTRTLSTNTPTGRTASAACWRRSYAISMPRWCARPATGGLIVSQWTAHALGVLSVFAEHSGQTSAASGEPLRGPFILRRGYDKAVSGKRVVVVDDVINTGLALRQTVEAVRQSGGQVMGAAAIITRGNARPADCGVTGPQISPGVRNSVLARRRLSPMQGGCAREHAIRTRGGVRCRATARTVGEIAPAQHERRCG